MIADPCRVDERCAQTATRHVRQHGNGVEQPDPPAAQDIRQTAAQGLRHRARLHHRTQAHPGDRTVDHRNQGETLGVPVEAIDGGVQIAVTDLDLQDGAHRDQVRPGGVADGEGWTA